MPNVDDLSDIGLSLEFDNVDIMEDRVKVLASKLSRKAGLGGAHSLAVRNLLLNVYQKKKILEKW